MHKQAAARRRTGTLSILRQIRRMSRLQEVKKEAMCLTDAERAVLASDLLQTLPVVLADEDKGVAEAVRRDAELDNDPTVGIDWNDLKKQLGR